MKIRYGKFQFLQRFNEGGAGDGGDGGQGGGTGGAGNGDGGQGGNAGGGGNGSGTNQPFAVFPDEASFMGRVSREARKLQKEFLAGLGVENEDALKTILTEHSANIEKNKTDLQKAQDAAKAAQAEREKAIATANQFLLSAESKLQAATLGVPAEKMDRFLKLADLAGVTVDNGKVDSAALKGVLESTLAEFPEFKAATLPPSGGGDFKGGDGGNAGGKAPLTMDYIKQMKPAEMQERLQEVMDFMAKQK